MIDVKSELLPVLPLDDVVVLPGMTVTLGVEGESQRAAIEAARQGNQLVLLVPRIDGKFAGIGTVAWSTRPRRAASSRPVRGRWCSSRRRATRASHWR